MDKGLQIQEELTKKGEKIILKVFEIIKSFKEIDIVYYCMANGIMLSVTDEIINIVLILEKNDINQRGIGIITNPFRNRIIAKEGIYNYLINNPQYYFDMEKDIQDIIGKRIQDKYSNIYFWFN